jgi:hypothetical protein
LNSSVGITVWWGKYSIIALAQNRDFFPNPIDHPFLPSQRSSCLIMRAKAMERPKGSYENIFILVIAEKERPVRRRHVRKSFFFLKNITFRLAAL